MLPLSSTLLQLYLRGTISTSFEDRAGTGAWLPAPLPQPAQPRLPLAPSLDWSCPSSSLRLGYPLAGMGGWGPLVIGNLPSSSVPWTFVAASDANLLRNSAPACVKQHMLFYAGWMGFCFSALNNSGKITVIFLLWRSFQRCCFGEGYCLMLHLIRLPALK